MDSTRQQLTARKAELYAAIRALQADYAEGAMDGEAYRAARHRFELEAASILASLDAHAGESLDDLSQTGTRRTPASAGSAPRSIGGSRWTTLFLIGVTLAAVTLLLATSLHGGTGAPGNSGQQAGTVIQPTATSSLRVAVAKRVVRQRPRNVDALLALAQAYSDSNDVNSADRIYLQIMKIDPNRPEAPTLHALVLAARKQYGGALALLRLVEQRHPSYARAWLTDGLVASRRVPGYARAINAWNRFLHLMPHGPLSSAVRHYIAALRRAEVAGR